jgi:3-deoxy-manno-octulosonate cytidylyltransferase (CMP-KDO synthetase)
MLECAIVVPARLGSQRFPRKLLQEVHGRPLILWTADNLQRIAPAVPLYFAVAEEELAEVLGAAGLRCIMTDPELPSGTDRIAMANREIKARQVVNVQADEPIIGAEHIAQLLDVLKTGPDVATLATPFEDAADFTDPNKVKAVVAQNGRALYFSRSPIPYDRDSKGGLPARAYWHLGLYGYSAEVLEQFLSWKASPLEQTEKLEQLRILENGFQIGVGITGSRTIGVDVPEDLARLESFLAKKKPNA